MRLLQSWAESLALFKPENLKPFLLITLKSIIETYKLLFTNFLPAIVAPLGLVMIFNYVPLHLRTPILGGSFLGFVILSLFFWFFLVVLCARPSVHIKNWRYVFSYWRHFIYYLAIVSLALMIFQVNEYELLNTFTRLYLIFFMAFLLDSNAQANSVLLSCFRALKMLFYNLPFLMIPAVFFICLNKIFSYLYVFVPFLQYAEVFLLPVLIFFYVCFYLNFYVKKKHEQFSLYFSVKGH
jgi:hypothetical protein